MSAATITRLTAGWQGEAKAFGDRDLSGVDYVYVWADAIPAGVRLEEGRMCLLVLIGVRADGTKELITLADGLRESTGSWADLLRARRRGMRAPVLAAGAGALGFWGALSEVFPTPAPRARRGLIQQATGFPGRGIPPDSVMRTPGQLGGITQRPGQVERFRDFP